MTTKAPNKAMNLLTTDEAATYLGVSGASLNRWRSSGTGPPYYKVGALIRYETEELRAWLKSRTRTSTKADS